MRGVRVAAGGGLVLFSVLYVVGWARAWNHVEYVRSYASAWEELLWLATSVAVVGAGALVLVATTGLLRGREPRGWITWATLTALCAAGALPAVRAMTVRHQQISLLPDPFRDHGPAWVLDIPFTDPLVWRGAALPLTMLALLWAGPVLVTVLTRSGHRRLPVVAGVGALTVLTGAFLHGLLSAAALAAIA